MLRNKRKNNTLPEKKEVLLNREYISLLCDICLVEFKELFGCPFDEKVFCIHPRAHAGNNRCKDCAVRS